MSVIVEVYDKKEIHKFYKIKHTDCCSFVCKFRDDFKIINYKNLSMSSGPVMYFPSEVVIKCPRCDYQFKFDCKKDNTIDVDKYKGYIEEISEDEYNDYSSKSGIELVL